MLSKNHPVILFIDRNGFGVYQDVLANIPRFNFTPDLVTNLDVISKEQFGSLIATFIQINKMVPSSLAVILSDDVIYVKDLENAPPKPTVSAGFKTDSSDDKEHKDEVQNFLENIPFEEVLAKVIKVGSVNRVVAVNKDLVMEIINAFIGRGFTVEAVTPSFMYGQTANFTTGLNPDNVKVILENVEILRSGNLLTNQEKMVTPQGLGGEIDSSAAVDAPVKKPQNRRQYILLGVFVFLLIILGVVAYLTLGSSQAPAVPTPNVKSASVNEVAPLTTPTSIQPSITIAPIDFKNIKVKITQGVQADGRAVSIKNALLSLGFQEITSEAPGVSIPEKSTIVFSQSISADLRNNIIIEIKKILPDISILESQDLNPAISILIGKS